MPKQFPSVARWGAVDKAADIAINCVIFAIALAGTWLAQSHERPITAVLIFLMGIIAIGARSNVLTGMIAGLAASFIYNFFLSEPVFTFGVSTADEVVPLIAFNVSALTAGALAGRLADSARKARKAERQIRFLFEVSGELQQAISVSDVAQIARRLLPLDRLLDLEIYVHRDDTLRRADSEGRSRDALNVLLENPFSDPDAPRFQAHVLRASNGEHSIAKFLIGPRGADDGELPDLQGLANLLALAVDRCLLLEKLTEVAASKRTEELKTAILSSVSHDLRTPLTAIEAAATSLRSYSNDLSAEQKDMMLDTISEQCRRLNRFTSNLLDMSRIQAGISEELLSDVDALEIFGTVLSSARQLFPGSAIVKQVRAASAIVRANPAMLEQVLFNVLENAILHGASREPIEVVIANEADCALIEITDFGPGVRSSDIPRIFDRFYRAGDRRSGQGSGLGLYIAKGFVEAFGGTIEAKGHQAGGAGLRITIRLPIVAGPAEPAPEDV